MSDDDDAQFAPIPLVVWLEVNYLVSMWEVCMHVLVWCQGIDECAHMSHVCLDVYFIDWESCGGVKNLVIGCWVCTHIIFSSFQPAAFCCRNGWQQLWRSWDSELYSRSFSRFVGNVKHVHSSQCPFKVFVLSIPETICIAFFAYIVSIHLIVLRKITNNSYCCFT